MKFSQMQYIRPDIKDALAQAEKIKADFSCADSFDKAQSAFLAWDRFIGHIDTMMSLAYTRNTIDTTDKF